MGRQLLPSSTYTGNIVLGQDATVGEFSQFELAWTSFDCPAAIIHLSNTGGANKEAKIHPTQKPIALYHWAFKKFVKPGDKILDTHLGSGSSRIVAYKMGIDFYATEIDKEYFESQEKRFLRECFGEIKQRKEH